VRVFPSAAAFGRHFSIPFCNFLLLSVRLLRPAAVAPPPPPPPPPAENFCNSYYMNESGVRCFFCPLPPPFPTAASAVSKCSRRRCNWPFFRNANNSVCCWKMEPVVLDDVAVAPHTFLIVWGTTALSWKIIGKLLCWPRSFWICSLAEEEEEEAVKEFSCALYIMMIWDEEDEEEFGCTLYIMMIWDLDIVYKSWRNHQFLWLECVIWSVICIFREGLIDVLKMLGHMSTGDLICSYYSNVPQICFRS
jgi:hypothetical protein